MITRKGRLLGLANMHKEFSETISTDSDSSYKYLSEQGINPDDVLREGIQEINRYLLLKKAAQNKREMQALLEKATFRIRKFIEENQTQPKDLLIHRLLEVSPAFQYRNLEQITDDEIREVLADVDLLKFLEDTESFE